MGESRRHALFFAASAIAITSAAPSAYAQAAGQQPGTLEEVIVTAQRREQRLQDVPVSVSAFSPEQIEAQQMRDVNDLSQATPSMTTAQSFSSLDIRINLRGVSELIPSLAVDPATGVYIDGVYLQTNAGSNLALVDMERVEVLKGPQGTLFGRNTVGGALNITTKKPDPEFGGLARISYGNLGTFRATAVLNVPLSERAGFRIVFHHDETDGYGRDRFLDKPLNGVNLDYVRASAKFEANENLDMVATAYYAKAKIDPISSKLTYVDPLNPLTTLVPLFQGAPGGSLVTELGAGGFYGTTANLYPKNNMELIGGTATINARFGAVNARSITGASKLDYDVGGDIDGSRYTYISLFDQALDAKQFSEEFQLFGDAMDGRLTWIGGLYYFHETGSQLAITQAIPPLGQPFTVFNIDGPTIKSTSYAAFAQGTYEILPKLRLTAGVRYTKDKRAVSYKASNFSIPTGGYLACVLAGYAPTTPQSGCIQKFKASFDYVPWTLGLDYKPNDDTLLYAKVSKGYRSGAWSGSAPTVLTLPVFGPVDPENILSPEIGAKFEFMDGRLRVNTAAYYSNYKNIQQNENVRAPDGTNVNILTNAGSGEIYGGELEVSALLGALRIDAALGLVHPEYTSGPSAVGGQPFLNVSKTTYNLGFSYPVELGFGKLTFSGAYSWRSKYVFFPLQIGNAAQNAGITQGSYGLLDAQAALEVGERWTLAVWGKNIADKKYHVGGTDFSNSLGFGVMFPGQPATYGVTASAKF